MSQRVRGGVRVETSVLSVRRGEAAVAMGVGCFYENKLADFAKIQITLCTKGMKVTRLLDPRPSRPWSLPWLTLPPLSPPGVILPWVVSEEVAPSSSLVSCRCRSGGGRVWDEVNNAVI